MILDFHSAYFTAAYTYQQFRLKIILFFSSLSVLLAFGIRVATLITKRGTKFDDLPFETLCTFVMLILLVNFNDPWYILHVNNPSFATFLVAQISTALFIAAMLIFWLIDVARHKSPELSPQATALDRFLHHESKLDLRVIMALTIFYIVLVIDFIILYGMFYLAVEGNPGEGEISFNQEKHPRLEPVLVVTYFLLAFYYVIYFVMLCKNLKRIMQMDGERVVMFCFSQSIHVILLMGLLLGAYSPHFENGGAQVFFYSLCNLYMFGLAYCCYPNEVVFKEYDIDENL